jgi:hypothetical protein
MQAIGRELARCRTLRAPSAERRSLQAPARHSRKNAKGVIVLDVPGAPSTPVSGIDLETTMRTSGPRLAANAAHSECIHKSIFAADDAELAFRAGGWQALTARRARFIVPP